MSNHEHNGQSIHAKVLTAITSGRVHMKPKWHFILHALLAAIGVVLFVFMLLYLTSLAIYLERQSGTLLIPAFGLQGWYELLVSLPWVLIVFSMFFIVILEVLVRRYAFAYRRPLLFSTLGIIIIAIVGGMIVARTSLHGTLSRYANRRPFPVAGRFYRGFGMHQSTRVHVGTISSVVTGGFIMVNRGNETLRVVVVPQTRFPLGMDFDEGDAVVVFGNRQGDIINAFGVRSAGDAFRSRMGPPDRRRTLPFPPSPGSPQPFPYPPIFR